MADNRTDVPGSGSVEPDDRGEKRPPPSPQAASHDTGPPEPEGATRSWGPVCLIAGLVGCGCLILVLLAFGIAGGLSWSLFSGGESGAPTNTTPPTSQKTDLNEPSSPPAVNTAPDQSVGDETVGNPDAAHGPGRDAAMAWARNRRSDWEATINDHSEDWRWGRLIMGPPGSGGTTWVEIQWDPAAGEFKLLDEGPIAQDGPAPEDVPEIYRPGEDVAKQAALGYVEQPDWVARVDSHSDDWRRATVSVGPPASEFIYVVKLQWNDRGDYYDQVSIDDVDYPGME